MAAISKRRWFQFSLRTFLIVVTLLAASLGYVSMRAREQKEAVARINELGGSFQYDYQIGSNPRLIPAGLKMSSTTQAWQVGSNPRSSPAGWPWLRKFVGNEFFQDVVFVKLDGTQVCDADLFVIGKLRRIKTLSLNRTGVSDQGLAGISGMSRLSYLGLMQTEVTAAGIRQLRPSRNGSIVMLENTSVGNEALPNLSGCAHLGLDGTAITSQGLRQLTHFKNLSVLSIQRTAVDDAAVPYLCQVTTLERLNVTGTRISGEGLFALRNALPQCRIEGEWADHSGIGSVLRLNDSPRGTSIVLLLTESHQLKLLALSNPLINDNHLMLLEGLDHLEVLDLRGTGITDQGARKLQNASPQLKIYR
jgi:Leucine Rich repeat